MKEFLLYAGHCAPIISALVCVVLLALHKSVRDTPYRTLNAYFLTVAFLWFCNIVYIYLPVIYTVINVLYYLGLFLGQVFFYRFVYSLTRLPGEKPFPRIHYIVPAVIVGVFAVWSLFVPFDVQLGIVTSRGEFAPGYEAYSRLFTARLVLRGVWNIFYTALAWWRLMRYRLSVPDFSADVDRSSLRWVSVLLILSFSLVPPSLLAATFPRQELITSLLLLIPQLLLVAQHAIVCYNMAVGNFVQVKDTEEVPVVPTPPEQETLITLERKRRRFERYMRDHKPYLDPGLRITDLVEAFHTNRSYLSGFINRVYGVNFSCYINRLRMQEFESLRRRSGGAIPEEELASQAGFENYQRYLRVKKISSNSFSSY